MRHAPTESRTGLRCRSRASPVAWLAPFERRTSSATSRTTRAASAISSARTAGPTRGGSFAASPSAAGETTNDAAVATSRRSTSPPIVVPRPSGRARGPRACASDSSASGRARPIRGASDAASLARRARRGAGPAPGRARPPRWPIVDHFEVEHGRIGPLTRFVVKGSYRSRGGGSPLP